MKLASLISGLSIPLLFGASCLKCEGASACTAGLLHTKLIGLEGGSGHAGWALQVTDGSNRRCLLGTISKIQFLDSEQRLLHYTICLNCADYLFRATTSPREMILKPQTSSFLLIGGELTQFGEVGAATLLDLRLSDGNTLRFRAPNKFGFSLGGTIDVSAWHQGTYSDSLCLTCE